MESIGIVRKVDDLGRIVLPIELRRTMKIDIKDPLLFFVDGDTIVLKKYQPSCIFCGDVLEVSSYKDKNICRKCLADLKD